MDSLQWGPQFETGLAEVDAQHRRLVELVNDFANETSAGGSSKERVDALFSALAEYAQVHFADEEQLMREQGIAPEYLRRHQGEHRAFLRQLTAMRAVTEQSSENTRALLSFLINWLAFHILGSDQQLAAQLELISKGTPATEAYARVVHGSDSSSNLLLGAVDDLLRLLAQRNAELVAANDQLERRVAERTAELSKTVATLKSTQAELVQAQKLESVGQLAAGIAHELNTPLQFVRDSLSFVKDGVADLGVALDAYQALEQVAAANGAVAPAVERVRQAVQQADVSYVREQLPGALARADEGLSRVANLVRSMKDFAHPPSAEPTLADLNRAIETTLTVAKGEYGGVADVVTKLAPMPELCCFLGELNHVVLNLVVNAAHAIADVVEKTGARGTITVETAREGDQVRISVSDTGAGIAPEIRGRVFDPFFTTKPVGKGTGQGLAIAYHVVVTKHGGTLTFDTEVGRGTTFHVRLPAKGLARVA